MLESTPADPIRLLVVDADVETRALIASLLRSHTGREYVVESVPYGGRFPGTSGRPSDVELKAAEALRESDVAEDAPGPRYRWHLTVSRTQRVRAVTLPRT